MIYSAHQISFIPWVGFWQKIYKANFFDLSIYDQYTEKTWINYSYIGHGNKRIKWGLDIDKNSLINGINTKIKDINVKPGFEKKILNEFYNEHSGDKYFYYIYPLLESWLSQVSNMNKLWLINFTLIHLIAEYLNVESKLVIMPKLADNPTSDIINSIHSCQCAKYISGPHGIKYLDNDLFDQNKIELEFQKTTKMYQYYSQSIVSLLSQYGYNKVIEILKSNDLE